MSELKVRKNRPYKVDYIDITEVVARKAPVHYRLVRVPTAAEAKDFVTRMAATGNRIIIGARRFYKKLPKENPNPIAIEKLFPSERAVEVMKRVDVYQAGETKAPVAAVREAAAALGYDPKSLATACIEVTQSLSGPHSPATIAAVEDLKGMLAHDEHEQAMDTFVPQITTGITTPQLQAVVGTKESFTVRTSGGQLGVLDPTSSNQAAKANADAAKAYIGMGTQAPDITVHSYGDNVGDFTPSQSNGRWLLPAIAGTVIAILSILYLIQHCGH